MFNYLILILTLNAVVSHFLYLKWLLIRRRFSFSAISAQNQKFSPSIFFLCSCSDLPNHFDCVFLHFNRISINQVIMAASPFNLVWLVSLDVDGRLHLNQVRATNSHIEFFFLSHLTFGLYFSVYPHRVFSPSLET